MAPDQKASSAHQITFEGITFDESIVALVGASESAAEDVESADEFERFERLTRRLVGVSKTDLDAAREQEKTEKS